MSDPLFQFVTFLVVGWAAGSIAGRAMLYRQSAKRIEALRAPLVAALAGEQRSHATTQLDMGRLMANLATAGTAHHRRKPVLSACGYCGAPGQRAGTRCEYCQVAVSK